MVLRSSFPSPSCPFVQRLEDPHAARGHDSAVQLAVVSHEGQACQSSQSMSTDSGSSQTKSQQGNAHNVRKEGGLDLVDKRPCIFLTVFNSHLPP